MDAVNFIREWTRMCKKYGETCGGCPLFGETSSPCDLPYVLSEVVVDVVEKWSKEHPLVTNGDKVMEIIKDVGVPVTARGPDFDGEVPVNTVHIAVSEDWWKAEYKGV